MKLGGKYKGRFIQLINIIQNSDGQQAGAPACACLCAHVGAYLGARANLFCLPQDDAFKNQFKIQISNWFAFGKSRFYMQLESNCIFDCFQNFIKNSQFGWCQTAFISPNTKFSIFATVEIVFQLVPNISYSLFAFIKSQG